MQSFSSLSGRAFSILAVGSFPQTPPLPLPPTFSIPFSILAVGSFPQTNTFIATSYELVLLSVSSLLDRFLRPWFSALGELPRALSVSSLLDRSLRRHCFLLCPFPRLSLSVSSLLDRFLRLLNFRDRRKIDSLLSVSSLLDRFLRPLAESRLFEAVERFQYPRCWIVSSDTIHLQGSTTYITFQYPRCWIVSSARLYPFM